MYVIADDRRSEQLGGPVPAAAHHHWPAERFTGRAGKDPSTSAPVCRVLQTHQSAAPTADTQVFAIYRAHIFFCTEMRSPYIFKGSCKRINQIMK